MARPIEQTQMESIVRRFVENKVSPEELRLLEAYFKTQEGLRCLERIIDEHEAEFDNPHLVLSGVNNNTLDARKANVRFRSWGALAAAVTAVVILAFSYMIYVSNASSTIAFTTAAGERNTITLPDGTVVIMNGNSSLSYNERDWEGDSRPLQFSGEAYFKVKSNPERPFIVNTSAIAIKVLGTTFNVKSYDEDPSIETTLVEGKVQIQRIQGKLHAETVELSPDHKATYSKDSEKIVMEETQSAKEVAWINGSLVFEDEPFSEIVKDLERWYGVSITVEDQSSMNCRFNAVVENESLEQVMQLFTAIGNLQYQFVDDHNLIIKGSICKPEAKK